MKRKRLVFLLLWGSLLPVPARADNSPTLVRWKGWTVLSSEALWRGRKHREYPLTYLFDGDPKTAWVFSGTRPDADGEGRFTLTLNPEAGVLIDELRIMNGYNKSRELFYRNSRVTEIKIRRFRRTEIDEPKAVSLPDELGWHSIPLGPARVTNLDLNFTRVQKGPVDDLCISELALYYQGRKVDMGMPAVVIQSEGGEAESDTSYLMARDGRRIIGDEAGLFKCGGAVWSPDGRRVSSLVRDKGSASLWIADAQTGRLVLRQPVPRLTQDDEYELKWRGNGEVLLTVTYLGPREATKQRTLTYRAP